MKFIKFKPKIGDVVSVSDHLSLKFEKIAEDLSPVWVEVSPIEKTNIPFFQGTYITVTEELWFVYDQNSWRVMNSNEHQTAYRQNYYNSLLNTP